MVNFWGTGQTDPLSHVWTNTYNSTNDLLTEKDQTQTHPWTDTYDGNGNLLTVTDPEQRQIQNNIYDTNTHLLIRTEHGSHTSYATWTEFGYTYVSSNDPTLNGGLQ